MQVKNLFQTMDQSGGQLRFSTFFQPKKGLLIRRDLFVLG
jgi:hypothetical protein